MEKTLELGESYNSKYPQHFQIFLDNCVKKYGDNFGPNDYLFAAVYFIILETGFSPVKPSGEFSDCESIGFDIRRLSRITAYNDEHIKLNRSSKTKYYVYQIPLVLGRHSSSKCELQGVPSADINPHLIINFLSKEPQIVKSLCLSTETYIGKNETPGHKYFLKNLKILSALIKNKMSIHIKDFILTNEEEGCNANLLCLPEEIQKKIIYYLADDPVSLHYFSTTCSYFYNFIKTETKLWEEVCFNEYGGWVLNKALQDTTLINDTNVFRTAFYKLKQSDARRANNHSIGSFFRL